MPKERYLPGKISYDKLFKQMEKKDVKKINLRRDFGIHPTTIQKIVAGETINTDTIIILCSALDCQPGDLMEYIPESDISE
ncbi:MULTISPECIES: helix-turn-helix domain-containing protein [Robinsoniella]|uniref:helix-turn-helix domain-containing protein n=1 Tax=Robinsoniella TaxID=588605 RepID=UPI000487FBC3|nr:MULTISPECIES: helix-turn-helix transcriptional regulator [Robinsoniella]